MIAKVQNYYTSLNMPYIYITKRRILGESFCVAQMVPFLYFFSLFLSYSKTNSFHFSYFSVQLQPETDFSAYSKKHMVWASSLNIFVWSGGFEEPMTSPWLSSCLKTPWSSSKWNAILGAECAPHLQVCWLTNDSWDHHVVTNDECVIFPSLKWIVSPYSSEQCKPIVSLSWNPVNPCCLILWRDILVILKELRASKHCMQLLRIVSSLQIQ